MQLKVGWLQPGCATNHLLTTLALRFLMSQGQRDRPGCYPDLKWALERSRPTSGYMIISTQSRDKVWNNLHLFSETGEEPNRLPKSSCMRSAVGPSLRG